MGKRRLIPEKKPSYQCNENCTCILLLTICKSCNYTSSGPIIMEIKHCFTITFCISIYAHLSCYTKKSKQKKFFFYLHYD